MPSNIFAFPTYGKAITLDDQGIYFTTNATTGEIHGVFKLSYEDDWCLCQLKGEEGGQEAYWGIMTESADYALNSIGSEEIRRHFNKAEYAEPRGAWQVIKNSRFGFGKFTPLAEGAPVSYAMLIFSGDEMHTPLLIHKADEEQLQMPQEEVSQDELVLA